MRRLGRKNGSLDGRNALRRSGSDLQDIPGGRVGAATRFARLALDRRGEVDLELDARRLSRRQLLYRLLIRARAGLGGVLVEDVECEVHTRELLVASVFHVQLKLLARFSLQLLKLTFGELQYEGGTRILRPRSLSLRDRVARRRFTAEVGEH